MHDLTHNTGRQLNFILKGMDFFTFFCVATLLWGSFIPKITKSKYLPPAELPVFNSSLVLFDSKSVNGFHVRGNHLSYIYAPWDAKSIKHTDDIELFMGSFFGSLPVTAFSCWKDPCLGTYSLNSFPRLSWTHPYGMGLPVYFEIYPKIIQRAKRVYNPLINVNTCNELKEIISKFEFTVVGRVDTSPNPSLNLRQFHEFATLALASRDSASTTRYAFSTNKDFAFVVMSTKTSACSLDPSFPLYFIFRSGNQSLPLTDFTSDKPWPRNDILNAVSESLNNVITNHKKTNLLLMPHLSTAYPILNNISESTPLLLLFTASQVEPDPAYDQDVYMFKALQLEYTFCQDNNTDGTGIVPSLLEQRTTLYRNILSGRNERCRMAVICPIWWRNSSHFMGSMSRSPWQTCGLDKSILTGNLLLPVTQILSSSIHSHASRSDLVNLAVHLLSHDKNPYETPNSFTGVDGLLAVNRINRMCCEFAVLEATDRAGVFETAKVRQQALELIRGSIKPAYSRICPRTEVINYAKTSSPNIAALGCKRWGNDTLTFATVSTQNPPHWVAGIIEKATTKLSRVAIVDSKAEAVFILKGEPTYENLASFIADFHGGVLERHLNPTEAPPRTDPNPDGLHQALTSTQLEALIKDEAKDVVVLFYGRHCGYATHGRGALYEFRALARYFANHKSLRFVVVDTDTVQLPWYLTVEYVPAILLFPQNRKSDSLVFPHALLASPDLYSNLVIFLKKHTTPNTNANSSTSNSNTEDPVTLAEHLRVHLSRILSAEALLDGLIRRLTSGLEDLSFMISKHSVHYIMDSLSGRLTLDRLKFSRDRLSSQWRRFVDARERLLKEKQATLAAIAKFALSYH